MHSALRPLRTLAVVDVRDGGPVRHARERSGCARALRDDCLAWFPALAAPLIPALDEVARRWLARSCSPFVGEIEAIAATLKFPGIWLLNAINWDLSPLPVATPLAFSVAIRH